ncbi:MAG: sulfatase, partial [Bacteroidota bacterium]
MFVSVFLMQSYGQQKKNEFPNIVLIFIDDMGYADVGCFGAEGYKTPNIDGLAGNGMRFTDFYASQAVCSASRASLLTGCYSERVGIEGALTPSATIGLNPEETTIAEILKQKGYATAAIGKWHLGHLKEFLPLQHGFDEYFGLPYSNDMWPVWYDGNETGNRSPKAGNPPLPLIEGNEVIDTISTLEEQGLLTKLYTQKAVKFIQNNKEKPFFLYMPHSMVHVPIAVSNDFKGKSGKGLFADVMMELDWSVGEVIKTLKLNGLYENTLVIFTSDNGPWLNFGNHAGSAKPLREGKGSMWEGGPRVSAIMQWPEKIAPGSINEQLTSSIDILPTIAEITASKLPEKKIDGISILPLLEGLENAKGRDHFIYYYHNNLIAVRKGDWKLVFPHTYKSYKGVEPGKNGFPGPYARGKVTDEELYNLKEDIGETINLTSQYPEIVKELQTLANEARKDLGDRLTNQRGTGGRKPGRIMQALKVSENLAKGKNIQVSPEYAWKYSGIGDSTLINGVLGSLDLGDEQWLGFQGSDFEAVIDLG